MLVRQRYRLIELQRIAEQRGMPLTLHPDHWPLDVTLCDSCMIAIARAGHDPGDFIFSVLSGVWAENADMADEQQVKDKVEAAGFDADAILNAARSDEIATIRKANTQEAIDADAIGAPVYVLNGEPFWGQDRTEMLDAALTSGRAPYEPA